MVMLGSVGVTEGLECLREWNRTTTPYPRDSCVHQIFEARADETPDAIALLFQGRALTYGALNRRSNQVARALRAIGIGPEAVVAVSMDRSFEMIIALLGILKAGAAYMPLDAESPQERTRFVLADAGVNVILTQSHRSAALLDPNRTLLCLDTDSPEISQRSDENLACEATAAGLAYVLFTSGSTGNPKGVMVEHRSIVRLVRGTDYARFADDEVFLQMAPLAFDASTFEIWGALLNGAKLAIIDTDTPTACEIGAAIAQYGVSTIWLTAGLFHQMVEEHLSALRGVRQLLAGGDVLGVEHVRTAVEKLPGCRLINGYGPTECTTFACCCAIDARALSYASIPIGRPIANTFAYILDDAMQPVPAGIQGEIFIGGDGVGRGYLNRPELTAEKFLTDPFRPDASRGGRMYRTGDLARYHPDGTIEFLGRADNQVKVRGYRIELDEITAALLAHPSVGSAAVTVSEEDPSDKRLEAYVTLPTGTAPTTREIREFLRARIPEYMIPSVFRLLSALPLKANGKVDRRALASCPSEPMRSGFTYVAPASDIERAVAEIWQEILRVAQIGLEENFFDIGGDSLRLTKMYGRIREATEIEFPVTALFQFPTVKSFAAYLHQSRSHPADGRLTATADPENSAQSRAEKQKKTMARWKQLAKGTRTDG